MRVTVLLALLVAIALSGLARAQTVKSYPSKTITIIAPYAPGGFVDIGARRIAEKLSRALNVAVIVDNKGGGSGVLGTNYVAKAAPDGYTIGMGNFAPLATNVSLMKELPYNPATDVVPIILVERTPLILIAGLGTGISSVQDLIDKAKAKPGTITYGSSGIGSAHHLSGAMFAHRAGVELSHVPYKSGSNAAADLLAGHIAVMFELGYAALPSVAAGKVKALAVTSTQRLDLLPDLATVAEQGMPGFEASNWYGMIAPKGTPPEIIARLSKELREIVQLPDVRAAIIAQASQPQGGTPEEFAAFIRSETAKWAEVIRIAKIEPQ